MIDAVYSALLKGNVCLTGGGGVGKTYTTNQIIDKLAVEKDAKVAVTALTGLASTHLRNGSTIHSFSGITNKIAMTDFHSVIGSNSYRKALPLIRTVTHLVVDEVSMMRPDTLELLDGVFRHARESIDTPFGGIKILAVGDFLQLPPVIGREEKLKEQWAFENLSWSEGNFTTFNLTEVKRQSEADFINGLNSLRSGRYDADAKWLLKECADRPLDSEAVVLMSRVKDVKEFNDFKMDKLGSRMENYTSITKVRDHVDYGDRAMVFKQLMDKGLEPSIQLKVGCRIMITANTMSGLRNGMTGTYLGLKNNGDSMSDTLTVELDNGKVVDVDRLRLNVMNPLEVNDKGEPLEDGFTMQFPVKPAFAITIHKSQGMSLDNVMVDSRGIFADGQLYVAASRARSLNGLSIMGFNKRHIKANYKAVSFYESLQ